MKNVVAVAIAVLGITAGAVGLARAQTGETPSASTTTTTVAGSRQARPAGRPNIGVAGRAVHGDLVVQGKNGFENVTFDRGTLTSSDAGSLTLHRPDGVDVTVKLDGQTRYMGVADATALQKDKPVAVVSKDGTARIVVQRDPNAPAPAGRRRGAPAAPAAPAVLEG